METPKNEITLGEFPIGGRLLVRSKKDWRVAVVSRKTEEGVVSISIASPSGYCYRIRRSVDVTVSFDGPLPYLPKENSEPWRENFTGYDIRW